MQKGVYYDPEIVKKVEAEAKKEHRSFSNMLMKIIREYFKKKR
jgi:hypothetical protein